MPHLPADCMYSCVSHRIMAQKLQDRITPNVTNFSRLRLNIEKQEGKRKYESDGEVMVGVFVCVFVEDLKRCKTSYSFDLVQFYFVLTGGWRGCMRLHTTKLLI